MKTFLKYLLLIQLVLLINSCTKQEVNSNIKNGFIPFHAKIIPAQPGINDDILIVDSICKYEQFQMLTISNFEIKYSRTYNSMMKLPCIVYVDTINVGKLYPGKYTLIYYLIDKSTSVQDSVSRIDTLYFEVR